MDTKDQVRYWGGALGAVALVGAIVVAVVVVQTPAPKPKTAAQTQAAVRTQSAVKPPAAVKPQAVVKPQAAVKPQPAPKPQAAVQPLTVAERKVSEELWVEQKKLDTDSGRVKAATPDGRRRVAETIAKQFNVPEKLVNDLRGRKVADGEITAALALSQQLMKHDKVTRQQALDRILAARKSGQGWGAIARSLGLKLGDVVTDVKKTDKQLAKLATVKVAG
jgi:hypothetical protein